MALRFRQALLLLLTLLSLCVRPSIAWADVPYQTYTYDNQGHVMLTQTSYVPSEVIDGSNISPSAQLQSPQSLFIDDKNQVYVADTGNARVVVFDSNGRYLRTVGAHTLSEPTGLFVDPNGNLFVADEGNDCVYEFSPSGRLEHTYHRPSSPLFGATTPFVPEKLVVDREGNLFIVSSGSVNGLIELNRNGDFLGYFGGNRAPFNMVQHLQRMFYTPAQLAQLPTVLPTSPTNIALGPNDGLIYTVTSGLDSQVIKRLNVAGDNLLPAGMYNDSNIAAITVDAMGDIYAVDSVSGTVFEYDSDGNLLSAFGGSDTGSQRFGLFKVPAGVAVSSDGRLYVLDSERGDIQEFRPTEFTVLEHKALTLYQDGLYQQSIGPWTDVLRLNSLLQLGHVGIGMADYNQGRYADALTQFRLTNDKADYSNAYWEIRRAWLLHYLSRTLIILAGSLLILSVIRRLHRRYGIARPLVSVWNGFRRIRLIGQLEHGLRVMRHPVDGFYELRREEKTSLTSATLLLLAYFAVHMYVVFQTNFLFSHTDVQHVTILSQVYQVFVPVFAWMICNYLVSTIHDGEGRFRDIYGGTIYALTPYTVLMVPITLMSKGLTDLEQVVYQFSMDGMYIWCGLLMFCMLREVHSYEIGQTVRNITLTLLGMIVMALLGFILFGLSTQVIDFVHAITEEVILRVTQ